MGFQASEQIVVVTRPTRLQALRAKYNTLGQAKFKMQQALAIELDRRSRLGFAEQAAAEEAARNTDFANYEEEDSAYQATLDQLRDELDFGLPVVFVDRALTPTYDFWSTVVVVVVGQDGLVANTAKYVHDRPIVAVNPDPERIDGILLPYLPGQVHNAVSRVLDKRHQVKRVTLAEVTLNDGQRMLAFNDFYIGARSHVSARYTLEVEGNLEPQSSSGVLVSTGAGSTGWMSSVFNMVDGVNRQFGRPTSKGLTLPWNDRRLMWAVREPFASKHSSASLVSGLLPEGKMLQLESLMPSGGVIFSDGVEADFLAFNSGIIARIGAAREQAQLVVG